MLENIILNLKAIVAYIVAIFKSSVTDLTIYELLIAIAVTVVALYICKLILKVLLKGFKEVGKVVKKTCTVSKRKCQKLQCKSCGRSLANCVCQKNAKRGYTRRLMLYRKEEKAARK